jgi:multidrug efflux pump subunit AcrA (membrane-fusion protein)
MIAKLKIVDYENKSTISVSSNCVQTTESGSYVVIAKAQTNAKGEATSFVAERRTITTGKSSDGKTEILTGLTIGDLVITTGYQELNNGQAITGSWMSGK